MTLKKFLPILMMFFLFSIFVNAYTLTKEYNHTYILDDTYVYQWQPDTNQDYTASLRTNDDNVERMNTIIKLDLTEFNQLYANVNNSNLSLYLISNALDSGEALNISIYQVYSNYTWNETTITWNNRPTVDSYYNSTPMSNLIISNTDSSSVYYNFDITKGIQYCYNNNLSECSFYLIAIESQGSPIGDDRLDFYAKEQANNRPKFNIEYEPLCQENWLPNYDSCLINDSQLKYYQDNNSCGTIDNLPIDNGSYVSCNYCTQDIQQQTSDCQLINTSYYKTTNYIDNNYYSCCVITGIVSDCSVDYSPYNITSYQYCTSPNLDFDFDIDEYISFAMIKDDKFYGTVWLNTTTETFYCQSYVKYFDEGNYSNQKLLQVNPSYEKKKESFINLKNTEFEDREYFVTEKGMTTVYFTKQNIVPDGQQYLVGVDCIGNTTQTKLSSEKIVYIDYENLNVSKTRFFWFFDNITQFILFVFILLGIILIIAILIKKLLGG